jgi:glycopeptide antibiotics resistance protein
MILCLEKRNCPITVNNNAGTETAVARVTRLRAMRQRWPFLALLVYAALLIFGTLSPFDFSSGAFSGLATHSARIEIVPFTHACPKHGIFCLWDRGLNLVIFAPVGALLALLAKPGTSLKRRVARATALGFAASVGIEAAQLFLPSRFPSTADVLLNTIGAFLSAWAVAKRVQRMS